MISMQMVCMFQRASNLKVEILGVRAIALEILLYRAAVEPRRVLWFSGFHFPREREGLLYQKTLPLLELGASFSLSKYGTIQDSVAESSVRRYIWRMQFLVPCCF
jgi:hypothetical protein